MADEICKDTTSIVKRYHDTLEHLDWDMDTSQDTETIDSIQFPRLTNFGLFSSGWQVLHSAPMLEELKLTARMINTHLQVLDIIPPHLKSLELDFRRQRIHNHESPILRYFTRIALQS